MLYEKFVQVGRVAFISEGKYQGKICCIVDVIDQNRALIDGPCSEVPRMPMNFKKLQLTKLMIKIGHSARSKIVKEQWHKDEITQKWKESTWAKNREAGTKRMELNDYERFKLKEAKRLRNNLVSTEVKKLKRNLVEKKLKSKPKK
ncbi:unnamed protein product [Gordionus sp. m RMFG-2023]|uniref:large ribosomal subunit protein eL14-like n=1 Tax=Gordionus sp. m RMFG-2023 TaxID=3053472 RepID=UPI0030E1A474